MIKNEMKIIRILLFSIPIIIIAFIFNDQFKPVGRILGKVKDTYDFKREAALISPLHQNVERVEKDIESKEVYQRIIGEPVYFTIKLPIQAKEIDLRVTYQNPLAPLFKVGAEQINEESKSYFKFETAENKIIEKTNMYRIDDKEKGLIFLQPLPENSQKNDEIKPEYASYNDFITNIPKDKTIALYEYDLYQDYQLKEHTPTNKEELFDKKIRGSHEILTYIKDENLDFTFYFQKRNAEKQAGDLSIKIYQTGQFINQFNEEANNDETSLQVFLENLPAGFYLLQIKMGDNIRMNKFTTHQSVWGFKNQIVLDDIAQSSSFYIRSTYLVYQTLHKSGLQTVTANGVELNIAEIKKDFSQNGLEGLQKVEIPKNDLIVRYEGIATIMPENNEKFLTNTIYLENYVRYGPMHFDYLIAKTYEPASEKNEWKTFAHKFKIEDLLITDNKVQFMLQFPGAGKYYGIKIGKIETEIRK